MVVAAVRAERWYDSLESEQQNRIKASDSIGDDVEKVFLLDGVNSAEQIRDRIQRYKSYRMAKTEYGETWVEDEVNYHISLYYPEEESDEV